MNTATLFIKSVGNFCWQVKVSSLPKSYTVAIDNSVNNYLRLVKFRIRNSGDFSGSGVYSSTSSNSICHKYVKNCHIQRYFNSKGHGYSNNQPNKSTNKLREWITNNPVV